MDQDVKDLVEYCKWITGDLGLLRDRVRIAEKLISDLRKSGQESVEELLTTLWDSKKRQEDLQGEADGLGDIVSTKEQDIARREDEIGRIKVSFIIRLI